VTHAPLRAAFTLIELLVVIATVAACAALLATSLARTKPAGQSIQCLSNTKRLIAAWQMYAHDNSDKIIPVALPQSLRDPGWFEGWLDWSISSDNTNLAFLVDARYSKLANYVNQATNLFKCPADKFLSSGQIRLGWTRRVRSYSANSGRGPDAGPGRPIYKQITKTSEFQFPSPAETWVVLDEHSDSINDAAFFSPGGTSWVDVPATYHNGAGGFAFADGHSEMHKWRGSLTRVRGIGSISTLPILAPGDADIHWMSYHTQRFGTNSY